MRGIPLLRHLGRVLNATTKRGDGCARQLIQGSWAKISQLDGPDGCAQQTDNLQIEVREQPLDLALPTLSQPQLYVRRAADDGSRRDAKPVSIIINALCHLVKHSGEVGASGQAVEPDAVGFGDLIARMTELIEEDAIVGDQEQAFGILVESSGPRVSDHSFRT